ncbi:MAG TPA: LysR family transcriptional regulator [Dokdonella sp.]
MDHFLAIRVFARVVESGSFTKAAGSLRMPKATVTKLVQSLEAHLRVKLLLRTTRRVSVTVDGAAYYERTRHLLGELEDIEATLGNAQASPRGQLRIDTGGSVASGILIPALPAFRLRYPEIRLELGVTDRTIDLVSENVDCVIRSTANDPLLATRRVGSLRWTTCATPAYLQRHGVPLHPRDLENGRHEVVGYFSALSGRTQPLRFVRGEETIEIKLRGSVAVNESNAHAATALAGLGLVQTLDFMARPHILSGQLISVLDDWQPAPQPVYVVYLPNRHLSAKLRVFVDWTAELFAALD